MRRWLYRVVLGGLLVWAIAVAAILLLRHQLIYPFRDWPLATQISGVPGAEVRTFVAPDGVPLTLWQVAPLGGHPTILYFMGNAGSLPSAAPRLAELSLSGFGIVAMNYRGAGGAPGSPSQEALVADALAVYDSIGGEAPVIYGTSLGAALAVQVAARRLAKALILESPFARLCETAEHHHPWAPACLVLWDERWESIDLIGRVDVPLLVLHGDADRIIPLDHGRKLFEAAAEPKTLVVYPGGRHNDLRLFGAGIEAIRFIEALDD